MDLLTSAANPHPPPPDRSSTLDGPTRSTSPMDSFSTSTLAAKLLETVKEVDALRHALTESEDRASYLQATIDNFIRSRSTGDQGSLSDSQWETMKTIRDRIESTQAALRAEQACKAAMSAAWHSFREYLHVLDTHTSLSRLHMNEILFQRFNNHVQDVSSDPVLVSPDREHQTMFLGSPVVPSHRSPTAYPLDPHSRFRPAVFPPRSPVVSPSHRVQVEERPLKRQRTDGRRRRTPFYSDSDEDGAELLGQDAPSDPGTYMPPSPQPDVSSRDFNPRHPYRRVSESSESSTYRHVDRYTSSPEEFRVSRRIEVDRPHRQDDRVVTGRLMSASMKRFPGTHESYAIAESQYPSRSHNVALGENPSQTSSRTHKRTYPATNEEGKRICLACGNPGRYKDGKCVEKWGPGPNGPGSVCDRCRKRQKREERRQTIDGGIGIPGRGAERSMRVMGPPLTGGSTQSFFADDSRRPRVSTDRLDDNRRIPESAYEKTSSSFLPRGNTSSSAVHPSKSVQAADPGTNVVNPTTSSLQTRTSPGPLQRVGRMISLMELSTQTFPHSATEDQSVDELPDEATVKEESADGCKEDLDVDEQEESHHLKSDAEARKGIAPNSVGDNFKSSVA